MKYTIAPTITACNIGEYRRQMDAITPFAKRIHVDLMDGIFAITKSPAINRLWLPKDIESDVHAMFQHPSLVASDLLKLKPAMIIAQAEANYDSVLELQQKLTGSATRFGISLLAATKLTDRGVAHLVSLSRYVLIFSGHLGSHGGKADLSLLGKVAEIKKINPGAIIGWDGGINLTNIRELVEGGVNVLNVGGAIQGAADPRQAYENLVDALASDAPTVV